VASCYEMLLPVHQTAPCHITAGVSLHQRHCANLKYCMKNFVDKMKHTSNVQSSDN